MYATESSADGPAASSTRRASSNSVCASAGPALLPLATCEYEAVTRRLELLARGVESRYALSQHNLGGGRLAVGPEHASHPAQQPGALERIADVRERSFEHLQRLGKCERRLGFVRGLETGRHGVVEAGRFE